METLLHNNKTTYSYPKLAWSISLLFDPLLMTSLVLLGITICLYVSKWTDKHSNVMSLRKRTSREMGELITVTIGIVLIQIIAFLAFKIFKMPIGLGFLTRNFTEYGCALIFAVDIVLIGLTFKFHVQINNILSTSIYITLTTVLHWLIVDVILGSFFVSAMGPANVIIGTFVRLMIFIPVYLVLLLHKLIISYDPYNWRIRN